MGKFIVEGLAKVEFEDRLLAHLQQVITAKLRRGECFVFSWKDDPSLGGGRSSVWLHPHASLLFKFHGTRTPAVNRAWLLALTHTANGPHGLYVVGEPLEGSADHAAPAEQPMRFDVVPSEEWRGAPVGG